MTIEIETLEAAALDPRARQHMAPMRDGVELATDVYLPDGQGPWPAVLVRLPYDKNGRYCWMPFIAGHFTERGYAFLPQDVRGKFRSGGEVNAFVHEVDDGYDTIQWITEQPWSNGDVGMWGDSYYGYTQWAAVASRHPALKAIVPRVTVADLFGWLDGDGVAPLYGAHYLAQYWSDGRTHHWTPDWTRRPLSELFDPAFELIGSRSLAFDRLLAEARGRAPVDMYGDHHPFTLLRIPTLHGVGWFDNITPPHMLDYERLMSDPETAPFQYLHAGSTDHENYRFEFVPIPESEDHDAHDDALERMLPRYLAPALDFFDAFLAGRSDPGSVPRVRWHLPNVGWHESPVWPPAGAREQRLHLTRAGGLSEAAPGEGAVEWLHDPEHLVPSTIENPFAFLYEYPDEDAVASRPDVAVFESADLADHLTLAGRVVAHLTVAGDGPSMNLHVKLIDVDPAGGSHIVLYGQRAVDNPGDGTAAEVYLGHTGYRLPAGHRLRLQVASSDYPLYVAHPGTSESPWFATRTAVNHQRLLTGGATPSHLSVTVLDD
jgi:predicted acyl esterase